MCILRDERRRRYMKKTQQKLEMRQKRGWRENDEDADNKLERKDEAGKYEERGRRVINQR